MALPPTPLSRVAETPAAPIVTSAPQLSALDLLLAEAMKQPGVRELLDSIDAIEKQNAPGNEVIHYLNWEQYAPVYNSCDTTELV